MEAPKADKEGFGDKRYGGLVGKNHSPFYRIAACC